MRSACATIARHFLRQPLVDFLRTKVADLLRHLFACCPRAAGVAVDGLQNLGAYALSQGFWRACNIALPAASLPQQKILHDEFAFAPRKRADANTTGYLAIDCFRAGFSFDDLIEGVAVRTIKKLSARCHDTPHTVTDDLSHDWRRRIPPKLRGFS
jgi:hypothetical protein